MRDSYVFYTDQLEGVYRDTFDQIDMYTGTMNLDELTKEEQMGQLLDMFLTAQKAGKPIEKIVGHDLQAFCKAFCADFGWKQGLQNLFDELKVLAIIMLVSTGFDIISVLLAFSEGTIVDFWSQISSMNMSGYLIGILISIAVGFVCNGVVRYFMFRTKRVSMKVLKAITYITAAIMFVLVLCVLLSDKTDFLRCPVWLVFACSVVYLAAYYCFNHKRIREKRNEKVRFSDLVNAEIDKDFPEEMEKKYQKANAQNLKKGKGNLSMEAFLLNEEKRCCNIEKSNIFYVLFPIIITAASVIFTEFESAVDRILYILIMLIVQFFIMRFFWKITKNSVEKTRVWITKKREEQK